jgi:hypothetical protein
MFVQKKKGFVSDYRHCFLNNLWGFEIQINKTFVVFLNWSGLKGVRFIYLLGCSQKFVKLWVRIPTKQ